jgi:hypothetical protein
VPTLPRTCTRCFNVPTVLGRTCWPATRSAVCTSKASPPNSPTRSPAWCSSTPPHPNPGPAQPTNTDPYNVIGRVAALSAASAHLGADACSTQSPTPLFRHAPGTRPAPTPPPPDTLQAPSRSMQWRTRRCSRRRP